MPSNIPTTRLGTVQVTPQAQIVDSYVRPAAPEGPSEIMRLAEALQGLQPGLKAYFQAEQKQKDAADTSRARRDALTEAQQDIKEVTAGTKFAQQSKVYQTMYKEQRGQIEGFKLRTQALQEYAAAGLENSTDPAEFDTFLGGFLKERLEGIEDPDVLRGAVGIVEQSANNLSLQNAAKVSENIQAGILEDAVTLVSTTLDTEIETSLREKRDFNPTAVMDSVNVSNARAKFLQIPGPVMRRQLTDAIVEKAIRYADPTILKVLDQQMDVGGGKKLPLADAYWKANRDSVFQRVEARQIQISDHLSKQAEREKKGRLEKGQAAVLGIFAKNPYAMPSAQQLAEFESFAPGLGEQALTIRNKLIESREKSSPSATLAAMTDFMQDPSNLGKLMTAVNSGRVDASALRWGMTTFSRASGLGDGDANAGFRLALNHPSIAPFMKQFDDASTDPILRDLAKDPAVLANARAEFNDSVLEFMEQHPKATRSEVRKYVSAEFAEITRAAMARMGAAFGASPSQATIPAATKRSPQAGPAPTGNPFDQFDEAQ